MHRCTRFARPLALPNTHVVHVVPPICAYCPVFLSRRLHDCSGARATSVQSNSHCVSSCVPHRTTGHMLLFRVVAAVPSQGLSGGFSNTTAVISHGPSAARLHCLVPVAHSTPFWCIKDFGVDQLGSGEGRAGRGESLAVKEISGIVLLWFQREKRPQGISSHVNCLCSPSQPRAQRSVQGQAHKLSDMISNHSMRVCHCSG